MKNFSLNLNQEVGVRFTNEGLQILEAEHNEQLKDMSPEVAKRIGPFIPPQVDEDGYSQIQLWQLLQSFSKYFGKLDIDTLFEMDIRISEKDLIEQTPTKSKSM